MEKKIHNSTFYQGDCVEVARGLPSESVDLIVTDPPYGINGDTFHTHYNRNEDFVVDGYIEIPQQDYADFSLRWVKEAARLLRPGGSIYIVSGYTNLYDILTALRQTDLREVNHIIWKYNFGVFTKRKYVSSHYHILYYVKPGGKPTFNLECRYGVDERSEEGGSLNYLDREDVWVINKEYKRGQVKNKNELPLALLAKIISYSSNEGDVVADLFLGGGSTARVAIGMNRQALGIELSPTMFEHATKLIAEVEPGEHLGELRAPVVSDKNNRGKPWTDDDYERLKAQYTKLREEGKTKAKTLEVLQGEFERGRFAILNAVKRLEERGELPGKKSDSTTQKTLV